LYSPSGHLLSFPTRRSSDLEFVLRGKLEQMQGLPQQDLIQQQSVKSLLLQMVGQESTVLREHAQSLIHFINGMQMQSVIEAGNLIQATLQLPSEKLGLHQDILLQFEGQKNETGNIDPDFCRIFFMLHLHHLEETIIDMHIQKRVVTLYVFNDNITTTRQKDYPLQEVLKENLLQLNYQLSDVRWQSIHQEQEQLKNINHKIDHVNRQAYDGFEYRI